MHFAKALAVAAGLVGFASSSPIEKRNNYGDATILNYALTLEHLEATFYRMGLNMYNAGAFSGANFPDWVRFRFTEIANHERTHVTALSAALRAAGVTPVQECTYNFGVTSPQTFLAIAQVLESVGVSAYLGAAPAISSKAYLAVAGSILVVETQHQTWTRSAADTKDGFPRPFAAPLDFNQVFTLAAPFITSCPSGNPTLPFKPFPAVTVTTAAPYSQGQRITIRVPSGLSGTIYAAFVDAVATQYQQIDYSSGTATVTIPQGITGLSYLILTKTQAINDAATVAGPAILEVPVPATNFPY